MAIGISLGFSCDIGEMGEWYVARSLPVQNGQFDTYEAAKKETARLNLKLAVSRGVGDKALPALSPRSEAALVMPTYRQHYEGVIAN